MQNFGLIQRSDAVICKACADGLIGFPLFPVEVGHLDVGLFALLVEAAHFAVEAAGLGGELVADGGGP